MAIINSKSTKPVIYAAYQKALAEKEKLANALKEKETEIAKMRSSKPAAPVARKSAPPAPIQATQDELPGIIGILESIEKGVGKAISKFSAKQVVEAEALEGIQGKIKAEKTRLADLYELEMKEETLENIIDEYEKLEASFEASFLEKKTTFESEYAAKLEAWKAEKEDRFESNREKRARIALEQKREKEEHNYTHKQEREAEKDSYKQKVKQLQQELADLKEQKTEEMTSQEKAISERESDFTHYKNRHETIPAELETAVEQASQTAAGIIRREAKITANLLAKGMETEQRSSDFRIKSLGIAIEKQEAQIAKLTDQLTDTLKQAQTLAIKALEGNASADSLDAIKAIAMEQAKVSKGK